MVTQTKTREQLEDEAYGDVEDARFKLEDALSKLQRATDMPRASECSMEGCKADAVNVAVIEYAPRGLGVPVRVRVPLCAADWSRRPEGI